jgi:transposase
MDLIDSQWQAVKGLIPPAHQGRGRPALDSRHVLDGILWKLRSDSPWRDLPSSYPSHQSCHRFYGEWVASGIFESLIYSLYSHLLYRGNFTPYQAFAEKRIVLRRWNRSFKLFIAPRFHDDWRTHTALLFMQILLKKGLHRLMQESETDYIRLAEVSSFILPFSAWPRYAPFWQGTEMSARTYTGPEDIVLELKNL